MKNWVAVAVASCLGGGIGFGITAWERGSHVELFQLPASVARTL